MEGQENCFVAGPLASILRVSKCICIAPLKFVKYKGGWLISLSRVYSILGYVFLTMFYLLIILAVSCVLQFDPQAVHNVRAVVLVVSSTLIGIMLYGAPRRMKCLITCLNIVKKVQLELKSHLPIMWNGKHSALLIIWFISKLTINAVEFLVMVIENDQKAILQKYSLPILELVMDNVIVVGRVQVMLVSLQLWIYFRAVNDNLRYLLTDIKQKGVCDERSPYKAKNKFERLNNCDSLNSRINYIDVEGPVRPHEAVRRASFAYLHACDAVRIADRAYGSIHFLLLGLSFLHLISKIYYFVVIMFIEDASKNRVSLVPYLLIQFSMCLSNVISLVIIIEPCHMTHAEMECTQELVSHLMQHTRSTFDPLAVELEQFCRQFALNKVSYRPLHITTMTRGLVLTIFSSIITYLVIMMDFKY